MIILPEKNSYHNAWSYWQTICTVFTLNHV